MSNNNTKVPPVKKKFLNLAIRKNHPIMSTIFHPPATLFNMDSTHNWIRSAAIPKEPPYSIYNATDITPIRFLDSHIGKWKFMARCQKYMGRITHSIGHMWKKQNSSVKFLVRDKWQIRLRRWRERLRRRKHATHYKHSDDSIGAAK